MPGPAPSAIPTSDIVVELSGVFKSFRQRQRSARMAEVVKNLFRPEIREVHALRDISMQIARGEIVAYAGPNGAGKSTTIKLCSGMLAPDQGTVRVLGFDPMRERVRFVGRIGVVFGQRTELWNDHPVAASFEWKRVVWDIPQERYERMLGFVKEVLGLGEFFQSLVRELSLGQRMRSDLGLALLHEPEILFLDEPTLGLDVLAKRNILQFIKEINQERRMTVMVTSHDMAELEQTLQAFEAKKGSQIAILIVPTVEPETIEQYALRVAEQWKLGRKKVDDGAILVVAKSDRALRIEVGYGLEGVLTDATSKRIISETIAPAFKQGDFSGGISAGVERMLSVIAGEPLPPPTARLTGDTYNVGQYIPILFLLALFVGGALRSVLGRIPGSIVTGGALAAVAWLFAGGAIVAIAAGVIGLVFTLLGGGMGRSGAYHVGGRHAGGLGGGFGGNGGFSGGGGGFGGGGASGRW